MTSCVLIADVAVAWDATGLDRDPFAPLVADLPRVDAAAAMHIRMRPSDAVHPRPEPAEASVIMFHGEACCVAGDQGWMIGDGASRIVVSRDGRTIDCDVNAASLARDEDFTFVTLMMALALAMRSHGRFHLHGAVVVLPSGRPVVIAGDSGRGKSTSTIALLEAGASWLCDDTFFVVGGEGDALTLHSMPRPFHVSPTTLDAFPRLRAHVTSELRPSGKYDVSAASAWPGRGLAATNVAPWIVLPEVHADCATAVVSIDQAETLLDIMPASAWVVLDRLDHQTEHASLLRRLVSGAVGFRASLGRDMLERPERLLEALVAAAPLPATSRR